MFLFALPPLPISGAQAEQGDAPKPSTVSG